MDERALARVVERWRLRLPRAALGGRVGDLSSAQVGASMELHDFREYQPGDDLRHLDWNAVARTDRLILRVRREEVAPRVEVLVDASRSMAITQAKRERVRELGVLLPRLARAQGLTPATFWLGAVPRRVDGPLPEDFEAKQALPALLPRVALRPCGVRVVLSDLLFDVPLQPLVRRLADGAARLVLVQVLDAGDEDPEGGEGARLVDAESGEALDRLLGPEVLDRYRARFAAHQAAVDAEARRVRAGVCRVSAGQELEACVRERLAGELLEPRTRVG